MLAWRAPKPSRSPLVLFAAVALLCAPLVEASAQGECPLGPARDSIVFFIGWRSTATLVGATSPGKTPPTPLPTDTLRGKLLTVACAFGNTRPTVEIGGFRYQLDDLNLPIWSESYKREFTGKVLLWRDGWLVPAAYLVTNGHGTLVDADSLHRALSGAGDGKGQLTPDQSARIEARMHAFVDSIRRLDDSARQTAAAAHSQALQREFARLRQEQALPAPNRSLHRWGFVPDTLPPGYTGDDLAATIRRLAESPRGANESDAEFIGRSQVDSMAWLAMAIDVTGVCGFRSVTFDQGAGELRINGSLANFGSPDHVMVPTRCSGGVTAGRGGAQDRTLDFVGILAPGVGRFAFDSRLKLSAQEARLLTPRIRLIAFARPAYLAPGGYVDRSTRTTVAKPSTPVNSRTTYTAMNVRDLTVVAVDVTNGRIVATLWPK